MVDVGSKPDTVRIARARANVFMKPKTLSLIYENQMPKGDVLATARIAGIMAAKRTSEIVPLCHPIMLSSVEVSFRQNTERSAIEIETSAKTTGPTGVEIEALAAAMVSALTVYDMCKAVDRSMRISDVRLVYKSGGQSGEYTEKEERL